MKKIFLKKSLTAVLALTLVSGAASMATFSQMFGNTVLTVSASDDLPFVPAGNYKYILTNNTDFVSATWNGTAVETGTELSDKYPVVMTAAKPFIWVVGNSVNPVTTKNSNGVYRACVCTGSDLTINPYVPSVKHDNGFAQEGNIFLKPENFSEGDYFYYDKAIPAGTLRASISEGTVSFSTVMDTPVMMYDEDGNQVVLTQEEDVYSFAPEDGVTYFLVRTYISGTGISWEEFETPLMPANPLPTPVVRHDNGQGKPENIELKNTNFNKVSSMFLTDKSFAEGELINLQPDPSTATGLIMVKPGTSVSVYRAYYGNVKELTKLPSSDSSSDNYTFSILPFEAYYVVKNAPTYSVSIAEGMTNGTVLSDLDTAAEGDTVTLTVSSNEGYSIDTVSYNDGTDHEIAPVDGTYSFEMPPANVTVSAQWKANQYQVVLPENMVLVDTPEAEKYDYGTVVKFKPDTDYAVLGDVKAGSTTLLPDADGVYSLTVGAADVTVTAFVYNVNLENTSTISDPVIQLNSTVTVHASAVNGSGNYKYAVYLKRVKASEWVTVQNFSTNDTIEIKPQAAVNYAIRVKVKDSSGNIVKKDFDLTVFAALKNTTTLPEEAGFGSGITINASATGGLGDYQYEVKYKQESCKTWTTAQSFDPNSVVVIEPKAVTTYDVCVKVMDSRGVVAKKTYKVMVTKPQNTSEVSETTLELGNSLEVTCSAVGGTAPYQFAVYLRRTSSTKWLTVQDFSSETNVTVTPAARTDYRLCVKVMDSNGYISKKYFDITVN